MTTTKRGRATKLTLNKFMKAVKRGDQLQRYDYTRRVWFCSFTICTEEDLAHAFHTLQTERSSARVLRPEVIIATGSNA